MAKKKKEEENGKSRREFLKNAGFLAGGVAGGMGVLNLAGCDTAKNDMAKEVPIAGKTVAVPETLMQLL